MTDFASSHLRNRIFGFPVKGFYSDFCSRYNISKKAARRVLFFLHENDYIEIVWRSPHGSKFFVKPRGNKS